MSFDAQEFETDTHMHTIASSHAYCTLLEMTGYAADIGLKLIAITDHGPSMSDGAHPWHFSNLRCLPPSIKGVRVLHGAEANIVDYDGNIDLELKTQKELDWVIASFHSPCCAPGSVEENTRAYLGVAENPYVDVIGHCGTEEYRYDYERVIPVFGEKRKLVEINSHSFGTRAGASRNCREIALLCKKYSVPIVVNSDAHTCFEIRNFSRALEMLNEIDFPADLIVNLKVERLAQWILHQRNRTII